MTINKLIYLTFLFCIAFMLNNVEAQNTNGKDELLKIITNYSEKVNADILPFLKKIPEGVEFTSFEDLGPFLKPGITINEIEEIFTSYINSINQFNLNNNNSTLTILDGILDEGPTESYPDCFADFYYTQMQIDAATTVCILGITTLGGGLLCLSAGLSATAINRAKFYDCIS